VVVIEELVPFAVVRVIVGLEPISMRWGPDRIRSYCRDTLGIDADPSVAFLCQRQRRKARCTSR